LKQFTDYPLGIRLWSSVNKDGSGHQQEEGYVFSLLENSTDAYRLTAFCGAGKVAGIFGAFLGTLPGEAFFILEFYPDEAGDEPATGNERSQPLVYYSPYLPVEELQEAITPYLSRLIHDGFVGFGFANNRAGTELFYSEEKILSGFTGNRLQFTHMLAEHGVHYRPDMLFPSDRGHDHLSLLCHDRENLPTGLSQLKSGELDYAQFCLELVEGLDMYQVEETLSFFLTRKEQDLVESLYSSSVEFTEFADEDFGTLLLDWHDFVCECEEGFRGDLWEYQQGLHLRDAVEYIASRVGSPLREKIAEIIRESDANFRQLLDDRRKRLDGASQRPAVDGHFWYHGVVRNQGVDLRRDLIRQGWFKP